MPRHARLSKADMAAALEHVFKDYGYEGASLKLLADAAALSKASLYHHFPKGKEEMAAHVLAHSGARLQKLVLAPLSPDQAGRDAVAQSLNGTSAYYDGAIPVCLMNSLLLGDGRRLFGDRIAAAVAAWQAGLAACLEADGWVRAEAEHWARDAIAGIQGGLVLCRVEQSRDPLEQTLSSLSGDL